MTECAAQGCAREDIHAKGLCKKHYNRKLEGLPEQPLIRTRPACSFPGCERPHTGHGLCGSHNWQRKQGQQLRPIAEPVDRKCSGPECTRDARRYASAGLCPAHDWQMRNRGSLTPIRDARPIRDPDVFWTRVRKVESGCWEWTANLTAAGYGMLNVGNGKYGYAHRYSWEHMRGPIPAGLTIDHLCRNRRCVNPDHLEPVTQAENNRRAREAKKAGV